MQNGQESQPQQLQNGLMTRPTLRRKSSAGLLSSFKTPSSSGSAAFVAPAGQQQPQQPQSSGSELPPTPPIFGTITSSSMTGTSRDWDSASLHSESAPGNNTAHIPPIQNTSVEYLRDVVQKRIVTLTYIRNTHEGKRHWFHTILLTRAELDKIFSNTAMRKQTYRFAILAMSLSNIFEIPIAVDFLRGVLLTLSEFDQFQDENFKPKMRFLRFSKPPKKAGLNDYSAPDATDTSYLVSPHMAFPLDYHQTLLSLLDILSEVYQKISRILGPSQFQPNTSLHMMGPLGMLSPHPGVSYVFSAGDGQAEVDPTLWGIVFGNSTNTTLGNPPTAWTVPMGDMFMKIDGKLKKIISSLSKELDSLARDSIREELASFDPLLRNVKEGPLKEVLYDFDSNL